MKFDNEDCDFLASAPRPKLRTYLLFKFAEHGLTWSILRVNETRDALDTEVAVKKDGHKAIDSADM